MSETSSVRDRVKALEHTVSAALPLAYRRRWFYLKAQRRLPSFRHPRTFSEKINWRMLHDRRELLAWTCDKLQMKEHALASGAPVVVPETLWSGVNVTELARVELPEQWVLKPTHRYGLVYFGDPDTDFQALSEETAHWLGDPQSEYLGEWAYSQAQHRFLVERLIGQPGVPPADYKVMVFDGEPHLVQVDLDRFGGHRRSLFTPDWQKIDVEYRVPDAGWLPRPPQLPRLIEAARVLGREFDFIRMDFYIEGDDIVFGEYTPYPAGGLGRFRPHSYDLELGGLWRLPRLDAYGR